MKLHFDHYASDDLSTFASQSIPNLPIVEIVDVAVMIVAVVVLHVLVALLHLRPLDWPSAAVAFDGWPFD